jgi:hypothetical protein
VQQRGILQVDVLIVCKADGFAQHAGIMCRALAMSEVSWDEGFDSSRQASKLEQADSV